MNTGSLFFFFFLISVAAIVLNPGAVDAGRVLKRKNIIVTAQADKIPCDHHNLLNGDHELVEGILKNKLPSGPSGGVGHNYINSVGSEKMKTSNTLKMNKLPSGPSPGVGHNYINSVGFEKMKNSNAENTLKMNKLPSGPSGGVGHK